MSTSYKKVNASHTCYRADPDVQAVSSQVIISSTRR